MINIQNLSILDFTPDQEYDEDEIKVEEKVYHSEKSTKRKTRSRRKKTKTKKIASDESEEDGKDSSWEPPKAKKISNEFKRKEVKRMIEPTAFLP